MSYVAESGQPSVLELARSGNPQAIAYWLNVSLSPHNLYAQAEAATQPGCIKILVEFHPSPEVDARSPEFQQSLMRFICHHVWKLNSDVIDGIQVVAQFIGKPQMLWRKSVRVVSPARRAKLAEIKPVEPSEIKTRIRQVTRQKIQFRAMRSLLLTGTTAAAFIVGCWLGYADSPNEQKTATAANSALTTRPDTVQTVLDSVPVEKINADTDGTATLLFGGDVALTQNYTDLVKDDQKWAFAGLEESRSADVAIVNLEAPFTTETNSTKSDSFKADPAQVEVLKNGGIDVVNLANDRIMDYQSAGLDETLKTLDQAGIRHFGAGRDEKEARRPEILDVDGQRVAYLGYFGSDAQTATADQPGTNDKKSDRIAADIKSIRDQVDWVIVNFHWGDEISKYPNDAQVELAHFSIDQGADLVVGHHSSILQGAELYKGRPIVYSLGNFIFGGKSESNYDSAMLRVALKDHQMKVELLPVEVQSFQPRIARDDRATEILQQIESVSDSFQQPLKTPVVIDAKTNTVTKPDGSAIEAPTSNPVPSDTPLTPEQSAPESTPTEESTPPTEPSSMEEQSAPAIVPSPEAQSSPDASPSPEQEQSSESPSSETQPSSTPSDTSSPTSDQPWNNNSFTNQNNESLAPAIPQEASPSPQATQEPHTHLDGFDRPIPKNSLEPNKRRYAEADRANPMAAFIP